jgi:hypothetical protein
MLHRRLSRLALAFAPLAPLVVSGCASVPHADAKVSETATIAAAAASAATDESERASRGRVAPGTPPHATAAAAAAAAAAQAAAAARPFADVVKDAAETKGLFNVWRKDDKVYLEISPDQFDHPYFFKSAINQGIGEARIFGGSMTYPIGVAQIVSFHKHGHSVQLIAKNVKYTAKPGTPEARAVAAGFSDSLLAVAPIASQPEPERKSVLIDANALLLADIPGGAAVLEQAYHQPYGFDARNSSVGAARGQDDEVSLEVSAHYALSRVVMPPPGERPHGAAPSTPITLPDVRSLFIGYHYTLAKLPDTPMHARLADERVGYFTTEVLDFTSDAPRVPVERYVNRWRLEKKDPAAALSEPKQPIVFWLDRNIPVRYREPIKEGILEWNKAFERIGFKDAIHVEVQPDDADFDTSDIRHASVRWQTVAKTAYGAIGPSVVDPRTGEILDADIAIDANNVRVVRNLRQEYLPQRKDAFAAFAAATRGDAQARSDSQACAYDDAATEEAAFGLSLLEARGDLDPDSPDVDRFVDMFLKSVAMHEVGHTLGLRHNFRASTVYTEAELSDPQFTATHGIAGSVMEYNPWNLAVKGERQGEYTMSTLGPYDYWAIEYGYKEQESADLEKIAARSSEPWLAYSTDEDVSYFAIDPDVNQLDLGTDPLAYARKRIALVHELWQRTENLPLKPGESYSILRRNFTRGLNEAGQGALYASKYIGGLTTLRDRVGSGRQPFTPVDAAKQRAALDMLAKEVLSADSFDFPPSFLRKMTVSTFDIDDAQELGRAAPPLDLSIDQQVLSLQRGVLDTLMSPPIAQRLLNNAAKVDNPKEALGLAELYQTLHKAVWSELATGKDITLFRRNLQREYATRVANALVRPTGTMPADARALLRVDAGRLAHELKAAPTRRMSPEAKAHLAEMAAMLDEAQKAPLVRQAI